LSSDPTQCVGEHQPEQGWIMAKRKKKSKVQKRAKPRRGNSAKRGKARKAAQAKRVAKAKPTPVKKAARKVKQPVAPVVESVAVEVIEQPAPGVITVTEVEETEIRKAS
jgi:phage-related minor tail protein